MLRADSLHAYVLTRSHACMFACLRVYMRTRLHALAYMLARLYVFTCLHTPVLLHAYMLTPEAKNIAEQSEKMRIR